MSKPLNPRDRLKKKMQVLLNKQCMYKTYPLTRIWLLLGAAKKSNLLIIRFGAVSNIDKADKLAEIEKTERQIQQQQDRDDEMREMALRLRRRYELFF